MTYRYRSGVRGLTYDARNNNSTTARYVKNQGNFSNSDSAQDFASNAGFTDPLDASTILLLQADGRASGSQNNTFLDSSSNNYAITANGNPTQGSVSPFGNTWSLELQASLTQYVNIANNTSLNVGSANFTVEAWVFPFTRHNGAVYGQWNTANSAQRQFHVYITNTGYVTASFTDTAGTVYSITSSTQYPISTWMHLALVRNSDVFTLYVNGQATGTPITMIYGTQVATNAYRIGATVDSALPFNGYISNVRQVNGTAVYTSNFSVPRNPLTAISGTVLLMAAYPSYILNGGSLALTVTAAGAASLESTRFSPFPSITTGSSFDVNGGSGYFDGTGDYLTLASGASTGLTGDVTLEAWVYATNISATSWIVSVGTNNTGCYGIRIVSGTGVVNAFIDSFTSARISSSSPNVVVANNWTHIALVRSAGVFTLYVNGVATGGTYSSSNTFGGQASSIVHVGTYSNSTTQVLTGRISGLRLVNSAVYTSNFTPSTVAPTAITGTRYLLNFTNAGVYDASGNYNFETAGTVSVQTGNYTPAKYGSGGIYFPGSASNYLLSPASSQNALYNNFTIEFWMRPFRTSVLQGIMSVGAATASGWKIELNASGYLQMVVLSTTYTQTFPPLVAYDWYHVAVVRQANQSSDTLVLYVNGNAVASTSASFGGFDGETPYPFYIGAGWGAANPFQGMLDEIRISRVARYQGPFTPPPRGYPPQ